MRLVRLQIDALPGIEPGFSFHAPSERVNLVTGPNAIGKSSLARALGYLLRDAQTGDPHALALHAEFKSNGTRWTVRRSGSQIVWTRDGASAPPPALPAANDFSLYRLSLENLLDDKNPNDVDLARRMRRQLRGGFDLDAPRIPQAAIGTRSIRKAATALNQARGELRGIERQYGDLRQREEELPVLEEKIKSAGRAAERQSQLSIALRLQQAIKRRKSKEQYLSTFRSAVENVRGDEIEQLEQLEATIKQLRDKKRDAQSQLRTAKSDLDRTGFSASQPAEEELNANGRRLQRLGKRAADRTATGAALDKADADREAAITALRRFQAPLSPPLEDAVSTQAIADFETSTAPPKLSVDSIRRSEEIAAPLLSARSEQQRLKQLIDRAGYSPKASEIDRWRRGVDVLRAWLASASAAQAFYQGRSGWLTVALWIALAASIATAITAYASQALLAAASAAATIVVLVTTLLVYLWRSSKARSHANDERRRFEETGLPAPRTWSVAQVRTHLRDRIEPRWNELLLRAEKSARANARRIDLRDTEEKLQALEADYIAFAQEVGFDPELPVMAFDRFVRLSVQFDAATRQRQRDQAALAHIDRDIAAQASQIIQFLEKWRPSNAPSIAQNGPNVDMELLGSSFDHLRTRLDKSKEALADIRRWQGELQSLEQRISECEHARQAIFARVEVDADEPELLVRLIATRDAWHGARSARDEARGLEKDLRLQLAEHPHLVALAEQSDANDEPAAAAQGESEIHSEPLNLQSLFDIAQREAAELNQLREQQTQLQTELRDAGVEPKLEQALAAQDRAEAALADKLDAALSHQAADLLLSEVEAEFQAEHEPPVLRRARALFAEVTAHEFTLDLGADNSFVAHDETQGLVKSLDALSSGTRMQLLLALRLAWTEALEQDGEKLPLFLDEALTTSDEARFKVMATSLERLAAAQGRQIFYLSARHHEAALWGAVTGTQPAVADLAELRFSQGALDESDYGVHQPPSPPAPGRRNAEEYATRLRVPALDPRLPGGAHPFHLLRDDLDLLHRLMDQWRIASAGQLERCLAAPRPTALFPSR